MYTTKQIVSFILNKMGYKRISKYVSSVKCTNEDVDLFIGLIKFSNKKDSQMVNFINYFL